MKSHALLPLLLTCVLAGTASGQTVYRCGNTYSRDDCPQSHVVEATAPSTAAQRTEAHRVAASERRLAAEMARDRRANEAAIKPADAGSLGGAPKPASAAASAPRRAPAHRHRRGGAQTAANGDFLARVPGTGRR